MFPHVGCQTYVRNICSFAGCPTFVLNMFHMLDVNFWCFNCFHKLNITFVALGCFQILDANFCFKVVSHNECKKAPVAPEAATQMPARGSCLLLCIYYWNLLRKTFTFATKPLFGKKRRMLNNKNLLNQTIKTNNIYIYNTRQTTTINEIPK